jgi:prepilin-type processing-associated H-X9-DG protein
MATSPQHPQFDYPGPAVASPQPGHHRERILTPCLFASLDSGEECAEVVAIDATKARETLIPNPRWRDGMPVLSVLVPFYRHDPSPLLFMLDRENVAAEVLLLDNGSADPKLLENVKTTIAAMDLPCTLIKLDRNEGRSKGRNRLARHARSANFLFVDSDMLPDDPNYLGIYIDLIEARNPAVVFGGYSVRQAPDAPEYALHRRLAMHSDCAPAAIRRLFPEKHVFTTNLLVRRDVFEEETFDESFRGWGWEDIEWSMRVGQRYPLTHIDNSCTHLGLNTARMLAAKFEQSAANFGRMVARHRDRVVRYRSYRAACLLKRLPLLNVWKPIFKAAALMESAPLSARAMAMRLYRATLYVDAV